MSTEGAKPVWERKIEYGRTDQGLGYLLDWIGYDDMVLPQGHMYGTTVPAEDGRHRTCLVVGNGASEFVMAMCKAIAFATNERSNHRYAKHVWQL